MRLEATKYLTDIQAATERIARFTEGKGFEHYVDSPEVVAIIPDHAKIVGFRNILVHGYAAVDDRIVWGVPRSGTPDLTTPRAGAVSSGRLGRLGLWSIKSDRRGSAGIPRDF